MAADVIWVGNGALKKEVDYSQTLDGIVEYVEMWTGNPLNVAWPNYAVGTNIAPTFGNTNLPNLVWYSADAEQGKGKALASYTAKASNRFDMARAKWSLEYAMDTLTFKPSPGHDQQPTFSVPYPAAVLTRTSYWTTPPLGAIGAGSPPAAPFSYNQPAIPGYAFHTCGVVYGWYKTDADPALTKDGWTLTERWKWIVTGSDA